MRMNSCVSAAWKAAWIAYELYVSDTTAAQALTSAAQLGFDSRAWKGEGLGVHDTCRSAGAGAAAADCGAAQLAVAEACAATAASAATDGAWLLC